MKLREFPDENLYVGADLTLPSAASLLYAPHQVPAHTLTLSGATNLTGTPGVAGLCLGKITISTSVTVALAATAYIDDAPGITGGGTLTAAYALYTRLGNVALAAAGGDVLLCATGIANNATSGFTRLPTTAGVPSGVPTAGLGSTIFDSTDSRLYVYNSAWKQIGCDLASSGTPADVAATGSLGANTTTASRADHVHKGVVTLAGGVGTPAAGALLLSAGAGIAVTQSGTTITIAASGGGAGLKTVNPGYNTWLDVTNVQDSYREIRSASGNAIYITGVKVKSPYSASGMVSLFIGTGGAGAETTVSQVSYGSSEISIWTYMPLHCFVAVAAGTRIAVRLDQYLYAEVMLQTIDQANVASF